MGKYRHFLSAVLVFILTAALFTVGSADLVSGDGSPSLLPCLSGTAILLFLLLLALIRANKKRG